MRLLVVGVYFFYVCQILQAQPIGFGDHLVFGGIGSGDAELRTSAEELRHLLETVSGDARSDFEGNFVYEERYPSADEWDEYSPEGRLLNALYRLFDFAEEGAGAFNPDLLIEGRVHALLLEDALEDLEHLSYRELAVTTSDPEHLIERVEALIQREKKKKGKQACEEDEDGESDAAREVAIGGDKTHIPSLPDEIWYQILLRLNAPDIVSFSEVCRRWYTLAHDEGLLGQGDVVCPQGFRALSLQEQCLWAIRHHKWGMFRMLYRLNQTCCPEYFMEAMRSGSLFVVRFLFERGMQFGDLFRCARLVCGPYHTLANATQEVRDLVLARESFSPLYNALLSASGLGEVLPGADLNALDPYLEYSPLLFAVTLRNLDGVRSLCQDDRVSAQMRNSAACLAAEQGDLDVLVCLIKECSASAFGVDARGLTPLHYAVYAQSLPCINFLASLGAVDLNAQGGQLDESALHIAVRLEYVDVIHCLAAFDELDVNARNRNGAAPVHVAVFYDRDAALRALAAVPGVDWNSPDFRGDTPVHRAVRFRKTNTLSFLLLELEDGLVNLQLQNDFGYTPRGLAEAINNEVALSLLEEDEGPEHRASRSRVRRIFRAIRKRLPKIH